MSRLIRVLVSAVLLALVARQFGSDVLAQLAQANPAWLALAMGLGLLQVVGSAWRWRYTAGRLSVPLQMGRAVGEYFLATLINQTVPGGVIGDAQRAWRHGRGLPRQGPAFQAVVIERLSGQIALGGLALTAWFVSSEAPAAQRLLVGAGVAAGLLLMVRGIRWTLNHAQGWRQEWSAAVERGLLARSVLPVQLGASFLVAMSYVAVYICCLLALGAAGSLLTWGALVPLVLFAMLIPFSVAGWGLREGAAALLWPLAGLPAHEGVAAAVLYGVIALLSGVPGLMVLAKR